ncbi:hypothetical protein F2Q69_00036245 [Brassica cretica]|uniref:Uncharacterized protein n=1 Tax=Brassica cretica TaxID=69181 RepID=A0A8S9SA40_BRACR|nr:hypothetical protein F2Q69_00036245 [Brassica cretica]
MVDTPLCCSEHDVSRCFSEHGGTLLMSWRSWPEPPLLGVSKKKVFYVWNLALAAVELMSPGDGRRGPPSLGRFPLVQSGYLIKGRFPFIIRQDKSLALEAEGWRQGPRPGGRDPDPGAGTQDLEAGIWKPEAGVISSLNIFPQLNRTSARSLGHQTPLSVVLRCTCARSERINGLIGDVWPGEWAIILDSTKTRGRHASMDMCLDQVNALRADITVAHDQVELNFSMHFWRLSGSMNRVEECTGQDPRILRGRILARIRIRGMKRFNKTRRPKLRILMLDSTSLACAS